MTKGAKGGCCELEASAPAGAMDGAGQVRKRREGDRFIEPDVGAADQCEADSVVKFRAPTLGADLVDGGESVRRCVQGEPPFRARSTEKGFSRRLPQDLGPRLACRSGAERHNESVAPVHIVKDK